MPYPTSHFSKQRWLEFENIIAGETIPAFGVFWCNGIHTTRLRYQADKPDGIGVFAEKIIGVNGPRPVADGKTGLMTFDWPALVKQTGSFAVDQLHCGPIDDWTMDAKGFGFRAMTSDMTINGTTVILVGPDRHQILLGKADSTHNKGTTGTVSIFSHTTDTGFNLTVRNRIETVPSGNVEYVAYVGDRWETVGIEP